MTSSSVGAIVLAAGKGTRMKSPRSKLLHPLLGEYLVAYPLRALHAAGVRQFVMVVGHAADDVKAAIASLDFLRDSAIDYVVQAPQRGTGHAVQVALALTKLRASEWFIACGDSPHLDAETALALRKLRSKRRASVVVLGAEVDAPFGYGRMLVDGEVVRRIVEERDATDTERQIKLVNAGAYCVDDKFIRAAVRRLSPKNAQNELYLTDIVGMAKPAYVCCAKDASVVLGVNSQAELSRSIGILTQQLVKAHQEAGVTIEPGDVVIGPRVALAPGAHIERGVTLLGTTAIAAGAHIEHHAHLANVVVAEGARVRAFTYAEDAEIGPRAQVGPVSRLRAGALLEEAAEVGNFCEVKKTRIKARAKAHHVSYLGDAEIGSGTNIGAGTIICNYDGFNKPFSRIGGDVFIGSNSTLVAPVRIEDGAYVAAGSVITDPVPTDALAFGRARQVTKDGYAKALKDKLAAQKRAAQQKPTPAKASKSPRRAPAKTRAR